uniref:Uncharacterized protein n=1 Tax=Lactuca sativa TaxID=4236 RepID=A0A9R1VAY4_LACSA|nr:hypothetical protein LSAT_V11C500286360 [Lactuca sativa]
MDYYGKRVISTSSDATIKIISVTTTISTATSHPLTTLTCHNGPVWQVAWAYPKFGSLLASHSDGILLQHILLGDSTTKVPSFLNYINYFMDYELRGYKISVGMAEKSAPRAPPAH